ncbi:fe(2+) transport protein 2 [Arachis hypogaea]|uniref:fe(2+) transport protein 2 n=1 Tax=Arachis hypogaea TaxID=3818 RepID=UPI003B211AE4
MKRDLVHLWLPLQYLGEYDKEEKAARAYDLAALKYWGPTATANFPVSNYPKGLEEMKHVTKQEFIASLRRKSSGFSRGASIYRGVTRHHQQGRWQARIGRVAGNKDLYLGTFVASAEKCSSNHQGACHNRSEALKYKIIAILAILAMSMIGVTLPMLSRVVPAIHPDRDLFALVKSFSSGVILATGYMHVLPDSFNDLMSDCLPENPWHKFPFTTFIAMFSAVFTLMVDSFSNSFFKKRIPAASSTTTSDLPEKNIEVDGGCCNKVNKELELLSHSHTHGDVIEHGNGNMKVVSAEQLLRYRVIAQVLELGIVVHSVVIGLGMGASDNPCTIRPLIIALCFHQFFEGMGLGGCILQAEYGMKIKSIMIFFFSVTTPFGIALGIALSKVYTETSPASLIVEGVLNAVSAGLLNYMALVELLATDFMGPKLQSRVKLQICSYVFVMLGAGGMSVMAIWA